VTLKSGDRVRLTKIEPWFFADISAEDVAFLRTCVGKPTEIVGFDSYGHAEIEFVRSSDKSNYRSHTVWVHVSWLEKA
jgi:signal peptidase I